jgi:PBSX family phage terminase large subunit
MTTYQIAELAPGETGGYAPRGAVLALWKSKDHEVMVSGPAETGKTYGCLKKLNAMLWKYPGAQAAMVRKTYASMHGTVLATYRNKVISASSGIVPYGGEKPEWFDYPNGSRLYVGGMDNPAKILSGERDIVYINQAEELDLADYETITTRCTGRSGMTPYPQIFGDCNPGPPLHWIKHRPSITILESRHEDNPTLFDEAGQITDQGRTSLTILDRLTGVRYYRLRKGLWVSAEGMVYDAFDPAIHLIDTMPAGWEYWRKIRAIDFGFKNPFVCQWWAIDYDGRMYLYREIYMTGRTVTAHARQINELSGDEVYEATVADHDAEDRATLAENGIETAPASKAISVGIQKTQERYAKAGDGRPRIYIMRDCRIELDRALAAEKLPTSTREEIESYVWPPGVTGKNQKEVPIDADNHGMDAMRYAVMRVDDPTPAPQTFAQSYVIARAPEGGRRHGRTRP